MWPVRGRRGLRAAAAVCVQCKACCRQVSVTATVLHPTRMPLTVWFWAAYLVTRTPMAAFQTRLGLASGVHGPTTYDMLYRSESTR